MRKLLFASVVVLAMITPAFAIQRAQVTCTPPAAGSGDTPTEYRIEREQNASGTWAPLAVIQVGAATGLVYVDRTASTGTLRYRCIAASANGPGLPSDPSQSITIVNVPGKAGVTVIIIQDTTVPVAVPGPKK